jgi:TetR/AcrR family transcriptional regulator, transcriptional repressor for nem operon
MDMKIRWGREKTKAEGRMRICGRGNCFWRVCLFFGGVGNYVLFYKPNGRFMSETKMHILKTALVLFLQKSYRDVTMNDIVDRTGLSKGAFYHYFKGKEDLFREIVEIFFTMGAVDYKRLRKDSLHSFYLDYVDFLSESLDGLNDLVPEQFGHTQPFNFFLILFEAVSRFPEFLEKERYMHLKDLDQWTLMVNMARKSGEISSPSTDLELADLFLFCTDGVFIRFVNAGTPGNYRDYLVGAFDSLYKNIKT